MTKKGTQIVMKLVVLVALVTGGVAFPDGAPVDACVTPRPNQPNHGRARPQPAATNPYQVVASGDTYGPGAQITVTIQGHENFKGFFIQARDANTDAWIGTWLEVQDTKVHNECSAITHADPKEKQRASLVWQAPRDIPHGKVYFTGTVLKEYNTFWSEIVNSLAA